MSRRNLLRDLLLENFSCPIAPNVARRAKPHERQGASVFCWIDEQTLAHENQRLPSLWGIAPGLKTMRPQFSSAQQRSR